MHASRHKAHSRVVSHAAAVNQELGGNSFTWEVVSWEFQLVGGVPTCLENRRAVKNGSAHTCTASEHLFIRPPVMITHTKLLTQTARICRETYTPKICKLLLCQKTAGYRSKCGYWQYADNVTPHLSCDTVSPCDQSRSVSRNSS